MEQATQRIQIPKKEEKPRESGSVRFDKKPAWQRFIITAAGATVNIVAGFIAMIIIVSFINIGNTTWGCIDGGWISMEYVYVDGTTGEGSGTGTVTGDGVNIRSGPGTDFGAVGSLNKGNTVKIHAQLKIGDMIWGCTDKGWVSMKYVDMND